MGMSVALAVTELIDQGKGTPRNDNQDFDPTAYSVHASQQPASRRADDYRQADQAVPGTSSHALQNYARIERRPDCSRVE